jgi:hypothetical protein
VIGRIFRRRKVVPEELPDLKVTFHYNQSSVGYATLTADYSGRSADSILESVERERKDDLLACFGSLSQPNGMTCFPARDIFRIDFKVAGEE